MNDPLHGMMIPRRIATLPKNEAGYPIPWFVAWVDGKPDFRIADAGKVMCAVKERLCWICGETLGAYKAFVIGPMCAVNRVSAEAPSHTECAIFSAKACPFLVNPKQKRRETNLPAGKTDPAGIMIERNPGVALVWVTRSYKVEQEPGGWLFRLGDATETLWFCKGREATRQEVLASIESGLPLLRAPAEAEGPESVALLDKMHKAALELVPA